MILIDADKQYTKFFGYGFIINVINEKDKTCFIIKPHDCRFNLFCNKSSKKCKKIKIK